MDKKKKQKINYTYSLSFEVRDYECDLQGIVNNARYLHYFEHARHQFLKKNGLDIAAMQKKGITPVIIKAELSYKHPLTSGDKFLVRLALGKRGWTRIVFHQDIRRIPDDRPICTAVFEAAVLDKGKPVTTEIIMDHIAHDTKQNKE